MARGTPFAVPAHHSPGFPDGANGMIQALGEAGAKVGVRSFDALLDSFDATSFAIHPKDAGSM